ncbi:hypothetical protein C468_15247 [Halorubrum kocurii JCM 14978]|uniref:Uncharacterized protein n=1 Tax=Halorubrum kocurii JCM 14978 TaxID=1230456 RepID=M0NQV9_9EURY|nr:hypothetical protein C468_15247 [Halorubrum kocurii JCM 14978]
MRPRDEPTDRGRRPPEPRGPNARERPRSRRRPASDRTGSAPQSLSSPLLVPGATLAALWVGAALAAMRAAGWLHRAWTPAVALVLAAVGAVLGAVAVAHVVARVAAGRVSAGR